MKAESVEPLHAVRKGTRRARVTCLTAAAVGLAAIGLGLPALHDAETSPGADATMGPAFLLLDGLVALVVALIGALVWTLGRAAERRTPPPSGWYADPDGQSSWRYWDGQSWSEY
jgi:hypothetical protein